MPSSDSFEEFLGEEVVDEEGLPVGVFACYWEHEQGKPVLLGVHCNNDATRIHVVPAKGARLNTAQTYVSVPFPRPTILKAPALECDRELNATFEQTVCSYYNLSAIFLPTRAIDNLRTALKRVSNPPAGNAQTPSSEEDNV